MDEKEHEFLAELLASAEEADAGKWIDHDIVMAEMAALIDLKLKQKLSFD